MTSGGALGDLRSVRFILRKSFHQKKGPDPWPSSTILMANWSDDRSSLGRREAEREPVHFTAWSTSGPSPRRRGRVPFATCASSTGCRLACLSTTREDPTLQLPRRRSHALGSIKDVPFRTCRATPTGTDKGAHLTTTAAASGRRQVPTVAAGTACKLGSHQLMSGRRAGRFRR